MAGQANIPYKVSIFTASLMVTFAVLGDLTQIFLAITGVGAPFALLVTFSALMMYGIWFAILGVNYFSGKKVAVKVVSVFTSTIVELVPFLDAIPTLTIGVVAVIWSSRSEDREEHERAQQEKGAAQ